MNEYVCDECNGTGTIFLNIGVPDEFNTPVTCIKCWGKVKLDWIENIFGISYEDAYKDGVIKQ